ncbi:MAG: hypothetical protein Q7T50_07430 [Candidatus Magasanikbacteria bacterium]|nr:hypothetical protein [Candidatus Magasanikbacteria bacterium]
MSRSLKNEQKDEIENRFSIVEKKMTDDWSLFTLISFIKDTGDIIGKSFSQTIEILLTEYSEQIKGRIEAELKNVRVKSDDKEKAIKIIMQMLKPQVLGKSSVTKSRDLVSSEKKGEAPEIFWDDDM